MPQRSRILHVLGQLGAGGAERFVVDLLSTLRGAGMGVELACLVPQRDAVGRQMEAALRDAQVPLHFGPLPHLRPRTVRWLSGLLSGDDVALVHVHLDYVETAFWAASFLHRRRYGVVRTLHNCQSATTGARAAVERWALGHSGIRHSISCGEACHEAHQGRLPGRMDCIPYGIRFDWPRHSPGERDARQAALGLDPALTHYVAVGSQLGETPEGAQKAHDILIRSWRQGELGRRGGRLHLLGDGPLRPCLEEIASGDASITFHGIRKDVHDWFAAGDTFVMPSRWEGLPLAGIEALGTGIPAIFSDIGPLRELGGTWARYFTVDDAAALSEQLLDRLGKRDSASNAQLRAVRQRYGIERAANGYLGVYARVLHESSPVPACEQRVGLAARALSTALHA